MSTQVYDFTLSASGSQEILAQGGYFKILSCTGPVDVLMSEGSRYPGINAGQGQRGKQYTKLVVRDKSGAPNVGLILVAEEEFVDDRIAGEVSIIDGEKSRVIAGGMFSGAPFLGATPANFSASQLWNPVGSGKRLICTNISFSSDVANGVQLFTNALPCTNNVTAARGANKLSGAAIGAGQLRTEAINGLPVYNNNLLQSSTLAANIALTWNVRGAVVITAGKGLVAVGTTVNTLLAVNFEWFEENV